MVGKWLTRICALRSWRRWRKSGKCREVTKRTTITNNATLLSNFRERLPCSKSLTREWKATSQVRTEVSRSFKWTPESISPRLNSRVPSLQSAVTCITKCRMITRTTSSGGFIKSLKGFFYRHRDPFLPLFQRVLLLFPPGLDSSSLIRSRWMPAFQVSDLCQGYSTSSSIQKVYLFPTFFEGGEGLLDL